MSQLNISQPEDDLVLGKWKSLSQLNVSQPSESGSRIKKIAKKKKEGSTSGTKAKAAPAKNASKTQIGRAHV